MKKKWNLKKMGILKQWANYRNVQLLALASLELVQIGGDS